MLPNLLIIGAMKCGTTSLHNYLGAHPEISMSKKKQLSFFSRENWQTELDWYKDQFTNSAKIRGEATPNYSVYPLIPNVPARIYQVIPDVRLIYIVGDPVKRITSQWMEWYAHEPEGPPTFGEATVVQPLSQALADWDSSRNPYVAPSRYATQLERYLRFFPQDRIAVVDQDALRRDRQNTLERVFQFLGVDPQYFSSGFASELNVGSTKRRHHPVYSRIRRVVVGLGAKHVPGRIRQPVARRLEGAFSDSVPRPEIPPHLDDALAESLHQEAERLRSLTGMAFDSWSV